ncbi:MAG: helix-turn-helix domain-containing protein [Patescibacteria group bacterium]
MSFPAELERALLAFGFDKKEARIYLAGLECNSASVLDIARRTGFARTTIYPIIENLRRRGYFLLRKIKGRTHYVAEQPEMFLQKLEERQRTFTAILPLLTSLHGTAHEKTGVTMYEGTDGFKQFWQRIFRSGVKEYCLLTTGVQLLDYVKEPYIVKRIIAERVRRGIVSRQLIPKNRETQKFVAKDEKELRVSRFLPASVQLPATILLFGNEVAFVTTRKENSVILVASGDISVTLRTIFELLWIDAEPST